MGEIFDKLNTCVYLCKHVHNMDMYVPAFHQKKCISRRHCQKTETLSSIVLFTWIITPCIDRFYQLT